MEKKEKIIFKTTQLYKGTTASEVMGSVRPQGKGPTQGTL